MDYRVALGLDFFAKEQLPTNYLSYSTQTLGGGARLGFALRENVGLQLRYSIYRQSVSLPTQLNDCILSPAAPINGGTGVLINPPDPCFLNGEASLAVRRELANGPVITSLVGYTLSYNTLDSNRNPHKGIQADIRQDFAGVGGDVNFVRTASDIYGYHEVVSDVVGILHVQGGHITGWNGDLRMLDHFQMGPGLVRGFAPAGIGPRDLTPRPFATTGDALGGTMYWGASLELQTPLYFLPKDAGVKVAAFADAGSLWNYVGPTTFPATGEVLSGSFCTTPPCPVDNAMHVRSSVGVGLIWESPFGPLRFDYSFPITKESYDRVQQFRFGGGTKF
jgi:outer membrane protein insertion porin family